MAFVLTFQVAPKLISDIHKNEIQKQISRHCLHTVVPPGAVVPGLRENRRRPATQITYSHATDHPLRGSRFEIFRREGVAQTARRLFSFWQNADAVNDVC